MLRSLARAFFVTCLAATLLVGPVPVGSPAMAAPGTVVRTVDLRFDDLIPAGPAGALRVTDAGRLRASRSADTPATRICSDIWFTALGVTWTQHAGDPIELQVATSDDGRSFGRSHALDAESGPDPGSSEFARGGSASTLLWTGGARCARIAFAFPGPTSLSDLEVHFVNASGSAAGKGTAPETVEPAGGFLSPAPAAAAARQPNFITRKQWGANPRLMNCTPDVASAVKMGFVHHTAGTNHYPRGKADDIVRSIYAYHTRGRGWCDIAYNFLVDRYGRAYEGRSGGITTPVVGAAQQGFNVGAFSVSLMGSFSRARPRKPMIKELKRVLAWRLDVAHVKPTGRAEMVSTGGPNTKYRKGRRVNLPAISLHRTTGYTDCPGQKVARRIGGIRDQVAKIGLPKIYAPRLAPKTVHVGGSRDIRIQAGASAKLTWRVSVLDPDGQTLFAFGDRAGDHLDLTWEHTPSHPYPTDPGRYAIRIEGEGGGGKRARTALVPFTVDP